MIILANGKRKIRWPNEDSHDTESEKLYNLNYGVPTRFDSTAYTKGVDFMSLAVENGCMYLCKSGGISSATLGTFNTVENGETEDGDVTWICIPKTSILKSGDIISSSTWTSDTGVTLSGSVIINQIETEIKVTAIPVNISSFTLVNTVDILYSSGKTEKIQKSIIVPVREL